MTARRIGAVLAAVVLIVGAVLVRRVVIDDDDDAGATTSSVAPTTGAPGASAAIVCSTELVAACAAVEAAHPELTVTVEPAGATLDRLAQLPDDAEAPIWLTVAPFPAMVDSLRAAAGLTPFGGSAEAIAATPLAIATPGRADVLATACSATPLWRCIGDSAGSPWTDLGGDGGWSTVRPSLGVVDRDAMALASFAAAVAGYLGTADITRAAWQADAAFIPWLRRLARTVDPTALSAGTPLATMATRPPLDVAATSDAERAGLAATADRFDASYPEPSMWLEAVLAVPDRVASPADVGVVAAEALDTTGWDVPSAATQPVPAAPIMLALRALWREATA